MSAVSNNCIKLEQAGFEVVANRYGINRIYSTYGNIHSVPELIHVIDELLHTVSHLRSALDITYIITLLLLDITLDIT